MTRSREAMGLYPNLKKHRTDLGWSIPELLQKIENAPSDKSVRRLERGEAIRLTVVNKIFNAILSANGNAAHLNREKEIVVVIRA